MTPISRLSYWRIAQVHNLRASDLPIDRIAATCRLGVGDVEWILQNTDPPALKDLEREVDP